MEERVCLPFRNHLENVYRTIYDFSLTLKRRRWKHSTPINKWYWAQCLFEMKQTRVSAMSVCVCVPFPLFNIDIMLMYKILPYAQWGMCVLDKIHPSMSLHIPFPMEFIVECPMADERDRQLFIDKYARQFTQILSINELFFYKKVRKSVLSHSSIYRPKLIAFLTFN